MRHFAITAALVFGVSAQVPAQTAPVQRLDGSTIAAPAIDDTVTRLMRAAEVTGVAISIFNDGKVAYSRAYGFRDTKTQVQLTPDSVMGAASLTKSAFAYMVMQLVDAGLIDLDTPVQNYLPKTLPEYPAYKDLAGDPRHKKITARMLLSHTAGFPNLRAFTPDFKLSINFEPGSRYAYSGEGIGLLQLVVETVTRTPLQTPMRNRVFLPLGMMRTSMIAEERFNDDYANGYDEWGRSLGRQQVKQAHAAGSMQTTLRDFTRLMKAVADGELVRPETRELMLTPQIEIFSKHQFPTLDAETTYAHKSVRLSYGLGWGLYFTPYGRAFFKEGHDEGFRHYAVMFDKPKAGLVIMTNSSNGEGIFKELIETLLGNNYTPIDWEGYTPYNKLAPRQPLPLHTTIKLSAAQLDRLVGRYAIPSMVVLKVTRQGDHLLMQENDSAPGELYPQAELSFFSKTSDDVVVFELDAGGRARKLTVQTGGRSIPVDRVP